MKTIKVSEATEIQLDWLVAKCNGVVVMRCGAGPSTYLSYIPKRSAYKLWEPTKNWKQGGPIIERECIATYASGACSVPPKNPDYWVAEILATDGMFTQFGPTPLIAAMRCYVVSKLGETVEVPKELE